MPEWLDRLAFLAVSGGPLELGRQNPKAAIAPLRTSPLPLYQREILMTAHLAQTNSGAELLGHSNVSMR